MIPDSCYLWTKGILIPLTSLFCDHFFPLGVLNEIIFILRIYSMTGWFCALPHNLYHSSGLWKAIESTSSSLRHTSIKDHCSVLSWILRSIHLFRNLRAYLYSGGCARLFVFFYLWCVSGPRLSLVLTFKFTSIVRCQI